MSSCATAARECSRRPPRSTAAEHLLIRPCGERGGWPRSSSIATSGWEWYCRASSAWTTNPAPGNKAGGITTVFEKSLGGVTKGGNHADDRRVPLREPITTAWLRLHGHAGDDPVSITGLVAGGCNLICFNHGPRLGVRLQARPSIKLATNSLMYRHMQEDMDINCGVILEGTPLPEVGRQIVEEIVAVASGKQSKSELSGVGEEEFAPWIIGPVM